MAQLFVSGLFLLLSACGAASNPLGKSTPPSQKNVFDVHLTLAQSAYDNGEIADSLEHAESAYALNPFSERAAILLGYVYLGLAGVIPFELIAKMDAAKNKTSSTTDGTSSELSRFTSLVGVADKNLPKLGTPDATVPEYPIWVPFCANKARQQLSQLFYVNKGIATLCKFVDLDVRLKEETRHLCTQITERRRLRDQSLFLWAALHLIESVIFHAIIAYPNTNTIGTSNLQKRAQQIAAIDLKNPQNIVTFQTQILSFASITEQILPTSKTCASQQSQTQFEALANDMTVVSLAFQQLPGIPPSFTQSIIDSMSKITKVRKLAPDPSQLNTLKANFTQKISKDIADKLKTVDPNTLSTTQSTSFCTAYGTISGNQSDDPNKPSFCP